MNVAAGWRHVRLVRELDRGETNPRYSSTHILAIAFFLALVGLAMAIYLFSIRNPAHSQAANDKEALVKAAAANVQETGYR